MAFALSSKKLAFIPLFLLLIAGFAAAANETNTTTSAFPGININLGVPQVESWQTLVIAVILIILAIALLWKLKSFIINAVLGVIGLVVLGALGIPINLSIINVVVCAVLGLIGLGLIIILGFLGVHL